MTWLRLALRNWRVASRLIILVAVPAILGLTIAGLRMAGDAARAQAYGQVARQAELGQQVADLAQAVADERDSAAVLIAEGRPAAGLADLHQRYAKTDDQAARVRGLIRQLDRSHPPEATRASAGAALTSIGELPGLRHDTAPGQASAVDVASRYATAIAGLFPIIDGIADQSENPVLITSVRALGSLSRLTDQLSQQQAILRAALAQGRIEPAAVTALAVAQAQETSDVAAFRSSATAEQSWALGRTLAGPLAQRARAAQQRVTAAGDGALPLSRREGSQWQAGMSDTIGWMRHAERQLGTWITADARAEQRSATRSVFITGGVALAGLVLTMLFALLIIRSVVRPLRQLAVAALDAADSRLPDEVRELTASDDAERPVPAPPIGVLSRDEIGQVARAVGRLHGEAVRIAGEQARLRDSVGVVIASFFRRSHAQHDRLLRLIDSMAVTEADPDRLACLFQMDSLATRMRRHSDTALVLAGYETPRRWTEPVALIDVLRAAAAEIEHYDQVALDVQPGVLVSEDAAVDIVHLLAELLENATVFSPDSSEVTVTGRTDPDDEVLLSITDAGPGLPEAQLTWLNWRLAHPRPADVTVSQHLGMFAVTHLAARHGIGVVLTQPPGGGTTAEVHLPAELILPAAEPDAGAGELETGYGRDTDATALSADAQSLAPPITAGPPPAGDGYDGGTDNADGDNGDDASEADGASEPEPHAARSDELALTLGAPVPDPAPAQRTAIPPAADDD